MKFPKKLRIAAVDYEVIYPHEFEECSDRVAQHVYAESKIWVSSSSDGSVRTSDKVNSSLMHEIVHAIDINFLKGELDEDQVKVLGSSLYSMFKKTDFRTIPEDIDIGGIIYTIIYPYKFKETKEYFSYSNHSNCSILVNADVSESIARVSAFFQVMSILSSMFAINLSDDEISPLASGILDTMDRNNLWELFGE